jgi:ABC-type glycerol-3-phosphate transport system permease component
MEQLPDSLMESARLDGANEFQIFFWVVMPNVKPAWFTLIILMFQALWGNTGGQFLRSEELKPLAQAFYSIQRGGIARVGATAAVGFITILVPITIFVITQSNIIQTMATSGMKD